MRQVLFAWGCIAAFAGCSEDALDYFDDGGTEVDINSNSNTVEEINHQTYRVSWDNDDSTAGVSPLSLTASDGTGLRLKSYKSKTVIEGPLAFTEIQLKFQNPLNREMEGRFEITLPPSAAISRLAMRIGKKWQEAEVVEKQEARRAYEDFLHRGQDPLLMEKKAGNQFRARVFPIPPRATKAIILSYSQELRSVYEPYELLLNSLPKLDEFDVDINFVKAEASSIETSIDDASISGRHFHTHRTKFAPPGNIEVHLPHNTEPSGLRNENFGLAQVTAALDSTPLPMNNLTVLFDTSASRAVGFEKQVSRLFEIIEELEEQSDWDIDLQLLCFDQDVEQVYEGPASRLDSSLSKAIIDRAALGASDLEGALTYVLESPRTYDRLLVFSDGIVTSGKKEASDLRSVRSELIESGFSRIDVIVDGDIRDETKLKSLTTGTHNDHGVLIDAEATTQTITSKLLNRTYSNIDINVPGASWFWPKEVNGIQPGDQVLVFADLSAKLPLVVEFEGEHSEVFDVVTSAAKRPLLERAWVRSAIDGLEQNLSASTSDSEKKSLTKEIIRLSTKHRVLSDHTALLVLETERDYRRFGIDRRSLRDILTVGRGGIDILRRSEVVFTDEARINGLKSLMGAQVGAGFGYGGFGLSGSGRGGSGSSYGRGYGGISSLSAKGFGSGRLASRRSVSRPKIMASACSIAGNLPRNVVRRIVRRKLNELRGCYNHALYSDSSISGRIETQFIIDLYGRVQTAKVLNSTVNNAPMEACVLHAIRSWSFPTPQYGGAVVVSYPFTFSLDDSQNPEPAQSYEPEIRDLGTTETVLIDPDSVNLQTTENSKESSTDGPDRQSADSGLPSARSSQATQTPQTPQTNPTTQTSLEVDTDEQERRILHIENAYKGRLAQIMKLITKRQAEDALEMAWSWRHSEPGNVLALVGIGESLESLGDRKKAARVYGSIIDLFPSRADMRRMSGQRLERLGRYGLVQAIDTYKEAVKQRPDHLTGHRLYAYALVKAGRFRKAINTLSKGLEENWRFATGRERIIKEDMSLVAAAWLAGRPKNRARIQKILDGLSITPANNATVRFVLYWESDANDVDLHVYDQDGFGDHAFFSEMTLPSGGQLYGDITSGYGPECFVLDDESDGYPYRIQAHYYSRGPMGYGMGKLQVIKHDGRGGLRFSERPFVIMRDGAYVNLGVVRNTRCPAECPISCTSKRECPPPFHPSI